MKRSGVADLPLHGGRLPAWLAERETLARNLRLDSAAAKLRNQVPSTYSCRARQQADGIALAKPKESGALSMLLALCSPFRAISRSLVLRCLNSDGRVSVGYLIVAIIIIFAFSSEGCASSTTPQVALESGGIYASGNPTQFYFFGDGYRTHIVDVNWLTENGYRRDQLKAASKTESDTQPAGEDIPTTSVASLEGSVITTPGQGRIYLVRGGVKHWIVNPKYMPDHLGGELRIVSLGTLSSLPEGAPFSYPSTKDVWRALVLAALIFLFFVWVSWFPNRIKRLKIQKVDHNDKDYVFRVVLLGLLISYVILRSLQLLAGPRFWAEEGTIWFQYAVEHGVWATLTYVFYRSGYMNLAANIGGVLAGTVARAGDMLRAPLASTMVALLFQIMPFVVLCLGDSRLFNSRWKLAVAGILMLTLPSIAPEIWLNSINSMSFAGESTLLLLFAENANWRPATRWAVRVLLVFCGLTGVYCVVLAPFFLAYYFYRRSHEHAVQGLILLAAGLVQGAVVVYFKLHGALPSRGQAVASLAPINVLYYHVMAPFIGQDSTRSIFRFLGLEDAWWAATSYPHWPDESALLAGWVSAILVVAILIWLCRREHNFDKLLLAGIFVMYSTVTTLGSLHGIAASRYAFLPAMTMLMLVFNNVEGSRYGPRELVCSAAIAMAISVGIIQFYGMQMTQGPPWREEFVRWKKDPNYGLRVWPGWWPDAIYYRPAQRHMR